MISERNLSKCKHNRLINGMINERLPKDRGKYFCTQCKKWIDGVYVRKRAKKKRDDYLAVRDE